MTDSTPPSIPPRKRPTTPTTAGRQTTSAPRTGSGPTWSDGDDAATHVPNLNGSNGIDRVHGARERHAPDGRPRRGRRTSAARTATPIRPEQSETADRPPRHLHRIVTLPSPEPATSPSLRPR